MYTFLFEEGYLRGSSAATLQEGRALAYQIGFDIVAPLDGICD